jgi:hypothetical protein
MRSEGGLSERRHQQTPMRHLDDAARLLNEQTIKTDGAVPAVVLGPTPVDNSDDE